MWRHLNHLLTTFVWQHCLITGLDAGRVGTTATYCAGVARAGISTVELTAQLTLSSRYLFGCVAPKCSVVWSPHSLRYQSRRSHMPCLLSHLSERRVSAQWLLQDQDKALVGRWELRKRRRMCVHWCTNKFIVLKHFAGVHDQRMKCTIYRQQKYRASCTLAQEIFREPNKCGGGTQTWFISPGSVLSWFISVLAYLHVWAPCAAYSSEGTNLGRQKHFQ